jgi:DEAD/DEAH box helicase domain-containing protein
MNYVVFDIETKNIFEEVGSSDPADLDISVISVYESNTGKMHSFLQEEFDQMWPIFERADAIIGYNSNHFDIPLLNKYYHGDLNDIKSIDIMAAIKDSYGKRIKLDNVANATLGVGKNANGLEAVQWWKEGKIDEIKKYCEQDVRVTNDVFEYIMKNKQVKFPDKFSGKIITVDIDITGWDEKKEKPTTTQSLF